MKYQTEYQRNFQKRTPRPVDDYTVKERKFSEVPIRRTSSLSPGRSRTVPASSNGNNNFAVIGPNEKFSNSNLYRLRQPIKENVRAAKPREYAILGRNEKFQDNVVYPLRKPVVDDDSSRFQTRRHKSDNHSCGIQTELVKAPYVSFDPQYGREIVPVRSRIGPQSEYQQQFHWKKSLGDQVSDQMLVEESKLRDRRSDPVLPLTVIDPSEKALLEKSSVFDNPPPRVEFDAENVRPPANRVMPLPITSAQLKKDRVSEYQARYKPIVDFKKPRTRKAFEAEQAEERKRKEIANAEHAHTDDEGAGGNVNLGRDFRQKHPQSNLRRWKSEYQTTYKPFWRFDYKNGKWYKDSAAEEAGFNPNLFWYKELVSTRKRADEYRANAQADHFNREHTLQLQTGAGGNKGYQAWDANNDDDADSVVSIDRNVERQREQQMDKQLDERIQSRIHYRQRPMDKPSVIKSDQIAQTEHQVDRVVYVDEPIPRAPSVATKAFIRNLNSSSVQQQLLWDSESLNTARTNSDVDFKSNAARDLHRKHYTNDESDAVRKPSIIKQENRGTATQSFVIQDRPQTSNGYTSILIPERTTEPNRNIRPATSFQETRHAAGQSSYDDHALDRRPPSRPPQSSMNDRSYQNHRYRDETNSDHHEHTPASKPSFQNHVNRLDERFEQTHNTRFRDDDVLSINSARSLSSSCSLASQTLERAQQNMNKYWGGQSPASIDSPKKPYSAKH